MTQLHPDRQNVQQILSSTKSVVNQRTLRAITENSKKYNERKVSYDLLMSRCVILASEGTRFCVVKKDEIDDDTAAAAILRGLNLEETETLWIFSW